MNKIPFKIGDKVKVINLGYNKDNIKTTGYFFDTKISFGMIGTVIAFDHFDTEILIVSFACQEEPEGMCYWRFELAFTPKGNKIIKKES